jgi:hypothetical protein
VVRRDVTPQALVVVLGQVLLIRLQRAGGAGLCGTGARRTDRTTTTARWRLRHLAVPVTAVRHEALRTVSRGRRRH